MTSVKTAISIEQGLLERIDRRAEERRVSRSRLLAEAAEDYLHREESRAMRARLDEIHGQPESQEDREVRRAMMRKQRRRLEGE